MNWVENFFWLMGLNGEWLMYNKRDDVIVVMEVREGNLIVMNIIWGEL